jgi:hypothetical protein
MLLAFPKHDILDANTLYAGDNNFCKYSNCEHTWSQLFGTRSRCEHTWSQLFVSYESVSIYGLRLKPYDSKVTTYAHNAFLKLAAYI